MSERLALVVLLTSMFYSTRSQAGLQAIRLAFAGQEAPGVPGAFFERFDQTPTIDQNGVITFRAFLHLSNIVGDANDEGIWSGTPGNFSLIAREARPVPPGTGAPEGAQFGSNLLLRNVSGHGFSFSSSGSQYFISNASGLSRVAYRGMNMGGDPANPLLLSSVLGPVVAQNASGQYSYGAIFNLVPVALPRPTIAGYGRTWMAL